MNEPVSVAPPPLTTATPTPPTLAVVWRFPVYILFIAALTLLLRLDLSAAPAEGQYFTEYSAVELSSLVMLVAMAALYLHCGLRSGPWRDLCLILALLCVGALVRELDFLFDAMFPGDAWQVAMFFVLLALGGVTWRARSRLRAQIPQVSSTQAFGLLMAAFLTIAVFSRLFGMKGIWIDTLGPFYDRSAKNLAEEGVELLGYGLLFIGTVETALWVRRRPDAGRELRG